MYNIHGDNTVDLRCDENIKNKIDIEINGNNNIIIIEQFVEVTDSLKISIVDDNCQVYIGKGSTFEETVIAVADNNNRVVIGEDCMFARDTKILASDFHSIIDLETGIRKNESKEVVVDNHVWIGIGAIVLKNTHIMSNSIVGANAVACGIVSPNSIFRGYTCKLGNKHEVTWERSRNIQIMPVGKKSIRVRRRCKTNCDVILSDGTLWEVLTAL